jgi:hypothetical protein
MNRRPNEVTDFARRRLLLWSGFSLGLAAVGVLLHPGGAPWSFVLACCAPFLVFVLSEMSPRKVLVVSLLALVAAFSFERPPTAAFSQLVCVSGFGAGLWLALRCRHAIDAIGAVAGQLVLPPDADEVVRDFEHHFDVELARARRHERPLALLSLSLRDGPGSPTFRPNAASVAVLPPDIERRRRELAAVSVLREHLYSYAVVCVHEHVIHVLVPEVARPDLAGLRTRLTGVLRARLGEEVHFGAAFFPDDAIAAVTLMDAAEASRTANAVLVDATAS